jgi:hypothetical protein
MVDQKGYSKAEKMVDMKVLNSADQKVFPSVDSKVDLMGILKVGSMVGLSEIMSADY